MLIVYTDTFVAGPMVSMYIECLVFQFLPLCFWDLNHYPWLLFEADHGRDPDVDGVLCDIIYRWVVLSVQSLITGNTISGRL